MRKVLIVSILLIFKAVTTSYGQYLDTTSKDRVQVLYIAKIKNKTIPCSYVLVNAKSVKQIEAFKDSAQVELWGEKARNGVIYLYLDPSVRLWSIAQLLKANNIKGNNKRLPLVADYRLVPEKESAYFDPKTVATVGLKKDTVTGEMYINVRSTLRATVPLPNTSYIKGLAKQ